MLVTLRSKRDKIPSYRVDAMLVLSLNKWQREK